MKYFYFNLFAFMSICLLFSCDKQTPPSFSQPEIPILAIKPKISELTVYLETIGELRPSTQVEIRPQVQGLLKDIHIAEGDWVDKGTPLFTIDPRAYDIKIQEAMAVLAIDQANLKAIHKKLERFQSLAQKDLMPQTEWDDLEAQAEKARGSVDLDNARINAAQLEREKCIVQSPVNGRIGKIDVFSGTLIDAAHTGSLTTISQLDPLIVEFTITEKDFLKIPKEKIQFSLCTLCEGSQTKDGLVTFIDNQFDSKTGLLTLRGKIQNTEHNLRPGQNVRIKIPIVTISNAMLIPQKTIRYNQQGPYVYVIEQNNTVATRQLTLEREYGEDQLVLEGLHGEEQIVLDGHLRLSPGAKVEIRP